MNDQAIPPAVLEVARALVASGLTFEDVAKCSKNTRTRPYRVKEVADALDVHVSTVYRDIDAGRLVALRVGSGRGAIRVPVEELDAYKALLKQSATGQQGEVAS